MGNILCYQVEDKQLQLDLQEDPMENDVNKTLKVAEILQNTLARSSK